MKKILSIVLILGLFLSFAGCGKKPAAQEPEVAPEPETPEVTEIPVPEDNPALPGGVLVMVDNHSKARPQSGLDKADVVFEIMAEGGITRYMAMFYTQAADKIGPVRSARYYFVQLAKGYDLPYAHVGGSVDGLETISKLKVKDLNEAGNAGKYFWRDKSRKAPHNSYTSTDQLMEAVKAKNYGEVVPVLPPYGSEFVGEPLSGGQVDLTYATGKYPYKVSWRWEEGLGGNGGQYRRYINGEAQATLDEVPLVADTIFVLAAKTRERNTDPVTSSVDIIGQGEALCIIENQVVHGTWVKESAEAPLQLLDSAGQPMKRKLGKTWIQIINSMAEVELG
jgi:predicted small lipoprotein YifL